MIAAKLISSQFLPLKLTDTAEAARIILQSQKLFEIPVVELGKVKGYLTWSELQPAPDSVKVSKLLNQQDQVVLESSLHLFEIIRLFSENQWHARAVIEEGNYLGIISIYELLHVYRDSSLTQPGGIIELQLLSRNYSLAEISRLVESNEAKILHVLVNPMNDENGHVRVTLKLNTRELRNILLTFERFQYQVTGVYMATARDDDFKSRFDNLINYLKS
ncbi:MAG: CBS domain-containing protein [Bacteroidia bacterium]|jgi:Mg/Co/Ni transporter MgtE